MTDAAGESTVLDGDEIILREGDKLMVTIENDFFHARYFRGKDGVRNIFR